MKKVITEKHVLESAKSTKVVEIDSNSLITPLAKDTAKVKGVSFQVKTQAVSQSKVEKSSSDSLAVKSVAIGADHGGFDYKKELIPFLQALGVTVTDVGTQSTDAVDYPDFAYAVGKMVQTQQVDIGIMIDGAGIGSAMACNKMPNILAACCHNEFTAKNAREHNHANVLTLGSKVLGIEVCKAIIKTFLSTTQDMGRHANRVKKIKDIESRFSKK